ncbi:MAG: FKBP-type peptidyl-prolyl cis-trans isomerase [Candidatus Ancillula trichonymphae]|nr:FKBP-type peptidyl-prolyl cis-trans isomerase [Candidatus Ancillula trichonymphae]
MSIVTGDKEKKPMSKKNKTIVMVASIVGAVGLIVVLVFLAFSSFNKNSFGDHNALKKLSVTVPENKKEALTFDESAVDGIEKIDKASGVVLKDGTGETISVGRQANVRYLMYAYAAAKAPTADANNPENAATPSENQEKKWQKFMSSWDFGESMPVEIFDDEDKLLSEISTSKQTDPTVYRLSKLCNGKKVGATFALFMPSSETGDDAEILIIGEIISQTDLNVDPDAPELSYDVPANAPEVKFDENGKPTTINVPGDFQKSDAVYVKALKAGDGDDVVTLDSTVSVHYTGWLLDGTKFDSSYDHGDKPVDISLNDVIRGWRYGITGQKVGAKLELLIPSEHAYGKQATGKVPADSYLVFYIEVNKVVKGDAGKPTNQ